MVQLISHAQYVINMDATYIMDIFRYNSREIVDRKHLTSVNFDDATNPAGIVSQE